MKNPLVTVTSDSLEDEKLKLIDDPDFNALIADKLQNSRFLNDLIGVRKECLRQKRVLDDKISQIMDKHHLNVLNTIEATVQISYYPTVEIIDENVICQEHRGKIIIGGSLVTGNALKLASQIGIRGIVVGGFDDQDLRDFLGYDLGVAITGHENLGVTVIATEGFGKINMAPRTFELLLRNQGQLASINGTTQIRAGVIRPEVIIPGTASKKDILTQPKGLDIGNSVRVIRNPYFGQLGTVIDLPMESSILDSGSKARVVLIQLNNDNRPVLVPRANVEILEDNDE